MGTVLTLTELTTNCVGNHSVIIMIKAVNKRYTVLRMRDATFSTKIKESFPGETNFEMNLEQ